MINLQHSSSAFTEKDFMKQFFLILWAHVSPGHGEPSGACGVCGSVLAAWCWEDRKSTGCCTVLDDSLTWFMLL